MLNKEDVIRKIFEFHGNEAVYVTNTGYISRDIFKLFPENKNIFYMQGSMGASPAIGLGIALNSDKDVVVFVGDGSFLMHLGITHTLRDYNMSNLHIYVLDNGCHESVGSYLCSKLESRYLGVTEIIKIKKSQKHDRVKIIPRGNTLDVQGFISGENSS